MKRIFAKICLLLLSTVSSISFIALISSVAEAGPDNIQNDIRASMSTTFYLDFDWGRQVINLTPQTPGTGSLTQGDYRNGFRVSDFYEIGAGAGGGGSKTFEFTSGPGWRPSFISFVGLIPFIGKGMSSHRFAANQKAVASMKRWKSLPTHASDLKNWANGDDVTYSVNGGIAFGIGASSGIGIVDATIMMSGEHEVTIEKQDGQTVLVSLSSTKVKSAAIEVGASFASLAASTASSFERDLSFMVDTSDTQGAKAYADLVRGNVATIQGLMDAGRLPQVKRWERSGTRQVARYHSFSIGLPFLYLWSWSNGKLDKFTDTDSYDDGTSVQTTYGIYVKDHTLATFDHHHSTAAGFYGVAFKSKSPTETSDGKFGQFYWAFSSDHSSSGELRGALRGLLRSTGFGRELAVHVPDHANGTNTVSLAVDITSEQTNALLATIAHRSKVEFERIVKAKQDVYFAAGDREKLCDQNEIDNCIESLTREGRSNADDMHSALKEMNRVADAPNKAPFAEAFAKFGRAMMHNQFTFQGALEIAGPGSPIDFKVQGTTISTYEAKFETAGSGVLNPKFTAPALMERAAW